MAEEPDLQSPLTDELELAAPAITRRTAFLGLAASTLVGAGAVVHKAAEYDPSARRDLPSPDVSREATAANPGAIAAAKGLVFGSCLNGGGFTRDLRYRTETIRFSNAVVPGTGMQWMTVQEKRGAAYDFSLGDEIYAWARAAGRAFWGHAIIDWTYLPEWLPGLVAEQSAGAAEALFKRHVQAMATHWRDKVFEQIVVNEAVTHVGMNPSIWFEKLGERYIDLAFHEAHKIEPTLPLMINEGSIEMDTRDQRARLDNYLGLIQRLRQRGVPFTAVGIQGHLKSDSPVNLKGLESFMKELATMGLSFMITELDVDDRGLPDDPRVRDAGVAAIMRDLLDLALEQPHCQGVNMWDLSDHDSWIVRDPRRRRWTGGGQRPTLLDASYKPKASWAVLVDCLERARGPAQGSRVLPAGVRSG